MPLSPSMATNNASMFLPEARAAAAWPMEDLALSRAVSDKPMGSHPYTIIDVPETAAIRAMLAPRLHSAWNILRVLLKTHALRAQLRSLCLQAVFVIYLYDWPARSMQGRYAWMQGRTIYRELPIHGFVPPSDYCFTRTLNRW